ncbi:site-specific integrase [Streptococcus dysgalactiae]|uniref:Tyrosine recombinase xerC n=1 Tax=Streptococcus dysgalactiae subsp. equisimilis AC-2713 TaxID=759913 RepID=A0AB33R4Z6_STREQ|nr:site-specific integrase [Streptococcus dysgalactiae]HEP5160291.1 tyrosine-type recombinase/integrase [Streptococcus pyogenes]QJD61267.1 tyrosine-type recombinase/integrase [Streptococcus dysgalactiae subsp. equisimilis]QJD63118.1 tyrosine-type recombinase/integrase [Streptococcus dysgalactiae subsp. equisimilis]QJR38582.1 tyrosine-type recombinase/integrase [Streptococcus dysgalactiae subsp. equisimilis]CCI61800.1 Tyrosine recombinase xerC [Streptococcus dysgalactiae subsp. equisimilis AC-2
MSITKTKNGTYRLRIYIPEEVKSSLGIDKKVIEKRFKLRSEAKKYELELQNRIDKILSGDSTSLETNGLILFSDFYHNIWWESYKAGQTTSTTKPPSQATIDGTEIVFRKHILPLLGNYPIDFLNQNKQVVLNLLTQKAEEYANFKVIRSYVNSIFDWAEELEYIETNRLSKTISRIKATKKIKLQEAKNDEDLYLSPSELQAWFTAFEEDLKNDKLLFKDYVLFYTTFFLGDRKSESYALQWKHINTKKQEIQLVQALDKYKNPKSTKGNKKTTFQIPIELANLLQYWKKQQKAELAKFDIIQSDEQYVFTYIDMKGNVNSPLHADYLNNKMKSVKRRHKELKHATPHKLRHTGATLAKQAGTSLEAISEALTHSDTLTTKTYVNTSNVVPMAVGEIAYRNLKK